MGPPERERRPGKGGAESRGGRNQGQDTPPPPDHDYDDEAPELEGYEADSLTADEWSAVCLAEARPLVAYRGSNSKWRYAG